MTRTRTVKTTVRASVCEMRREREGERESNSRSRLSE